MRSTPPTSPYRLLTSVVEEQAALGPLAPRHVPVAESVPAGHLGSGRIRVLHHVAELSEVVEPLRIARAEVGAAVRGAGLADQRVPRRGVHVLAGAGDAHRPADQF